MAKKTSKESISSKKSLSPASRAAKKCVKRALRVKFAKHRKVHLITPLQTKVARNVRMPDYYRRPRGFVPTEREGLLLVGDTPQQEEDASNMDQRPTTSSAANALHAGSNPTDGTFHGTAPSCLLDAVHAEPDDEMEVEVARLEDPEPCVYLGSALLNYESGKMLNESPEGDCAYRQQGSRSGSRRIDDDLIADLRARETFDVYQDDSPEEQNPNPPKRARSLSSLSLSPIPPASPTPHLEVTALEDDDVEQARHESDNAVSDVAKDMQSGASSELLEDEAEEYHALRKPEKRSDSLASSEPSIAECVEIGLTPSAVTKPRRGNHSRRAQPIDHLNEFQFSTESKEQSRTNVSGESRQGFLSSYSRLGQEERSVPQVQTSDATTGQLLTLAPADRAVPKTRVTVMEALDTVKFWGYSQQNIFDVALKREQEGSWGLWSDAFGPFADAEFIVNLVPRQQVERWLEAWKSHLEQKNNKAGRALMESESIRELAEKEGGPLVLVGPTGSGKTCLVHAVATQLGFDVKELSASDARDKGALKAILTEAQNLNRYYASPTLLLLDDCDVHYSRDGDFVRALRKALRKFVGVVPVIITCTDASTSMRVLKKIPFEMTDDLERPTALALVCYLKPWLFGYTRRTFDLTTLAAFVERRGMDIRKSLNDLQFRLAGQTTAVLEDDRKPSWSRRSLSEEMARICALADIDALETSSCIDRLKTGWRGRVHTDLDADENTYPFFDASGSVSDGVWSSHAVELLGRNDNLSQAGLHKSSVERSIRNTIASLTTYLPDFVRASTTATTVDYMPSMIEITRSSKRYQSALAQLNDSTVTHCALAVRDAARMYSFPRP